MDTFETNSHWTISSLKIGIFVTYIPCCSLSIQHMVGVSVGFWIICLLYCILLWSITGNTGTVVSIDPWFYYYIISTGEIVLDSFPFLLGYWDILAKDRMFLEDEPFNASYTFYVLFLLIASLYFSLCLDFVFILLNFLSFCKSFQIIL